MSYGMWQAIVALPFSWRQRNLAKRRRSMSSSEFIRLIKSEGGAADAAHEVRESLLDWVYVPGFTPYPDDSLSKVYGIADEELDEEIILTLLQRLRVPTPSTETLRAYGAIDTPIRIAKLVQQIRADDKSD